MFLAGVPKRLATVVVLTRTSVDLSMNGMASLARPLTFAAINQ